MTTSIKTCFKCGAEKPLTEYYKHKAMADGHLNKCKTCTKKDSTNHRNNNIDKIRAYDRERGNRQSYEYVKEYRATYPNKYKAHMKLNNELRQGRVKRVEKCRCGKPSEVAHHDDYLKPLEVRWMCQACHKQWHRDNGEGLNP